MESFRFVSNLENIHLLADGQGVREFLESISDFNSIQSIRDFEREQLLRA